MLIRISRISFGFKKYDKMNPILKLSLLPALSIFAGVPGACAARTFDVTPSADTFVATGSSSNPDGDLSSYNFGGAGALTVESGSLPNGEFQTVIMFNLSGAENYFNSEYGIGAWTVQSVSLQLTSSAHPNPMFNAPAAGQFGVSLMANNSWIEGTGTGGAPATDGITYYSLTNTYINNAADQALGTFQFGGGSSGTSAYGLGLSSGGLVSDVEGGDDLSLRLFPADNNVSYLFNSSRAASGGPELVITAVPEPGALELAGIGLAALSLWRFIRPRLTQRRT